MPAHDRGDLAERLRYLSVAVYAKDHPGMDGETIGRALTRGATKAELLAYAVDYVDGLVDGMRRRWAHEAEDRAAQAREPVEAAAEAKRRQEHEDWAREHNARVEAERIARYERLLADPARTFMGIRAEQFREWAGERFPAWHEQARALAVERGSGSAREFDAYWHPGGSHAYWAEYHHQKASEAIEEWAAKIRLETTRELLGTLFALGDGTSVTWGAATVDQHEQRVAMLARNATGIVETAARHQAAVRMIKDAGVECLADLAGPDDDGLAPVPAVAP